ncbi:MAG TPA: MlaE family lipid ABC transporter permease subunit [Sulfuricella sp.]|nr:MlaE family lipid ABC transporter permease subunit [Sulfuricella sp.]
MKDASTMSEAEANLEMSEEGAVIYFSGTWILRDSRLLEKCLERLSMPQPGPVTVDCSSVNDLDTAGAWLIFRTIRQLEAMGCTVSTRGLRREHGALLDLIRIHAVEEGRAVEEQRGFLERTGRKVWLHLEQLLGILSFLGETSLATWRCLMQPSRIRWRAILFNLQVAGFNALPIVGLLAFLIGVVIAYQGAEQLARYGANIFVADLVGLSILREMAPLLTAIIVAGRSGSAYAAQIGTMKVTEEIDALQTIGVSPMDLLVLPKMVALIIALPLLTVYADILGVFGGMIMAQSQLNISFVEFLDRFGDSIQVSSFLVGVGKAPVFAAIIALVGCFQGFRVSGSSESVGRQTTVSVVQAIFLVIVFDALFSVIFSWLKI